MDLGPELERVLWASKAQPEWNADDDVPKALLALATAVERDEASRAYHRLLFAVGNNHAGTYFPVVLDALPYLRIILEGGTALQRGTVLGILLDLTGSFAPDPDHRYIDIDGHQVGLKPELHERIRELLPLIGTLSQEPLSLPAGWKISEAEFRASLGDLDSMEDEVD